MRKGKASLIGTLGYCVANGQGTRVTLGNHIAILSVMRLHPGNSVHCEFEPDYTEMKKLRKKETKREAKEGEGEKQNHKQ